MFLDFLPILRKKFGVSGFPVGRCPNTALARDIFHIVNAIVVVGVDLPGLTAPRHGDEWRYLMANLFAIV
eukprot:gene19360-31946_t